MNKFKRRSLLLLCLLGGVCCQSSAIILVQISNLVDYNFGTVIPAGVTQTIDNAVCAYTTLIGDYTIEASGTHDSSGNFHMASGPNEIVYSVFWKAGSGSFEALTPGTVSAAFGSSNTLSPSCALGPSTPATLRIQVTLTTVPLAGTYNDTLSLLMAPT